MPQFDLIIVGAGMAGLCAAVEASSHGQRVLVLEKQPTIGGSSLLSGCFMAFAETDFQKANQIQDSTESLIADFLAVGQYKNKKELVLAYGAHQLQTYNWLVEQGVQFLTCQAVSGHSNPRGHTISPPQAIGQLEQNAKRLGATIITEARVVELIKVDDQVVGVKYVHANEVKQVTAHQGVLLTSGGFSQSKDLLAQFAPQLRHTIHLGGTGNEGDGLKVAVQAGAWLTDLPYLKGTYGFHPSSTNDKKRQAHAFYKGGIIVNKQGERFVNESISYKLLADEALKQSNDFTYQIWDETVMQKSVPNDALYDFQLLFDEGLIERANSVEALAELIHIPVATLQQTIDTYNESLNNGQDAFGRRSLTYTYGRPTPIQTAPFYAMKTTAAMLATYAGIEVDTEGRVLTPFKQPIKGLYAAGEIVGGFHGDGYMTGSSLGKAAIFGRIAARTAIHVQEGVK